MKLSNIFFSILLAGTSAFSQSQAAALQPNALAENWFPQKIESLGQFASSRTEFSLDHNMVVLASKIDQQDESLRRVIAGVDGISVHRFRFQGTGTYDPAILSAIRQDYHAAGWQHLADAHDRYGYPRSSDLWLHFQDNTIRNIAVLVAGGDQVTFVSVSGSISPVDLLHLAGHFGIPGIQGGVAVQVPAAPNAPLPPDASAPASDNPPPPDVDYRHPNSAPQVKAPPPADPSN